MSGMDRERLADVERRLHALDGELSPVPPKPTLDRCQCYSSMHDACFYELFSAKRPAPAVEKPTPTFAGYPIVVDENWPGPGMIGVKQPAPAAPEMERVSKAERDAPFVAPWICCVCKEEFDPQRERADSGQLRGNYCTRCLPAAPASSKGEKPMSEHAIGMELMRLVREGYSGCETIDKVADRVVAKARELLSHNQDPALLAERNALAQENAGLRDSMQRMVKLRETLREERDALKLQVDDARRRFDDIAEGCRRAIDAHGGKQC